MELLLVLVILGALVYTGRMLSMSIRDTEFVTRWRTVTVQATLWGRVWMGIKLFGWTVCKILLLVLIIATFIKKLLNI